MPSDVDAQPPGRPPRPGPPARRPARGRPPAAARRRPVDAPPPPPRSPRPRRSSRSLVIILSALTVVVVGGGALAVALGSGSSKKGPAPAAADAKLPTTTFHDSETGFSVDYPRSWQRVDVPLRDYRLAVDGGSNVAFTVRVVPIEVAATADNLENFKAVTDGIVTSNNTVKILKQQAVSVNGMLGYYYFYTFTDGVVSAVHAHYFLFQGKKMNILVFQSLPDDFARLAPIFDQVAESFRSDPSTPGPAAAPATTTTTG